MVAVVVFEFSVMRCQPLRRALAFWGKVGRKCNCCTNFGWDWLVISSINRCDKENASTTSDKKST
ncbi:hypothetical protein F2K82_17355 [Vibrio cholerae]|nr:hypothetical protein [Vibrio cholerae]EGQ9639165.1 hypothetical protein [Vibrio cholerae]TQQ17517.1 hypothetical protein FLL80_18805 [Vibrio cholerae]